MIVRQHHTQKQLQKRKKENNFMEDLSIKRNWKARIFLNRRGDFGYR